MFLVMKKHRISKDEKLVKEQEKKLETIKDRRMKQIPVEVAQRRTENAQRIPNEEERTDGQ